MYARITTLTGAKDFEAGIAFVRDTAAPVLQQQAGYRGTIASADRAGGVFGVLSLWDTEQSRDASDSALAKVRDQAQIAIGGKMTVELFEETLLELVGKPAPGSCLLLRRVTMDPSKVEDNIAFFKETVLPQIKANPGLLAVRQLINRTTGEGLVGTLWTDTKSRDAGAADAEKRQAQATGRVILGEQSRRELVFVDLV